MPYSPDLIRDLALRHGIPGEPRLMPAGGMVNEAWAIGDAFVLRIVTEDNHAECDAEAEREAAVVPLLIEAGVMTPELVAHDATKQHAPRPYTIYRRARGVLLGYQTDDPANYQAVYREIGRQIVRIASIVVPEGAVQELPVDHDIWVPIYLGRALAKGMLSEEEVADINRYFRSVAGQLHPPERRVLLHRDIHPWNVMIEDGKLSAILDWGDASCGDPAFEFSCMPMAAEQAMIEGYIEAGGEWDEGMLLRSRAYGLQLGLWEMGKIEEDRFARPWWRMHPDSWRAMV